jgi:hypothetical protein
LSHNPYSPPQAAVAEMPDGPPRPKSVRLAVWLLWPSLILGTVMAVHTVASTSGGSERTFQLIAIAILSAVTLGLAAWVFWSMAKGLRWARIVCSVFLLLRVFALVSLFRGGVTLFEGAIHGVEFLLEIVAAVLLFTPSANAWFRPRE